MALAAAASARADTVLLHNGDRLSGKIAHMSKESLTLDTAHSGKLRISWSAVATLSADTAVVVLREGTPWPERLLLEEADAGHVRVRYPDAADSFLVPLESLQYLNPKPEESGQGLTYKGRLNVSAARSRGNSSSDRAYAETEFRARAKEYRYVLDAKTQRDEEAGRRVASRTLASATYDRFLGERQFWYLRSSLEHDRFKDIDLRASAGVGYGVRLIEDERTELSLRAGLDKVWLNRISDGDENYPALGWGVTFSHWLEGRRLQLFHDQQGFWNLDRRDDMTLRSRTGMRIPVAEGLTASAQLNVDWEREPAPGRNSTDTTWLLGLSYDW